MSSLQGKVAIVTGGSRGIGAGIARLLGARGASVVVNYTSLSSAKQAAEVISDIEAAGSRAIAVQADMGTLDGPKHLVQVTIQAFQKIDIIVNNAGIAINQTVGTIASSDYQNVMNVNVRGPLLLVQESLPFLQENGRIINISSAAARSGSPGNSMYSASKAALEAMSRVWASEFGPKLNITSNCVNPGPVATDMAASMSPERRMAMKNRIETFPLPRYGDVEDISLIVAFLASEDSRWVTGDVVSANGGALMI